MDATATPHQHPYMSAQAAAELLELIVNPSLLRGADQHTKTTPALSGWKGRAWMTGIKKALSEALRRSGP